MSEICQNGRNYRFYPNYVSFANIFREYRNGNPQLNIHAWCVNQFQVFTRFINWFAFVVFIFNKAHFWLLAASHDPSRHIISQFSDLADTNDKIVLARSHKTFRLRQKRIWNHFLHFGKSCVQILIVAKIFAKVIRKPASVPIYDFLIILPQRVVFWGSLVRGNFLGHHFFLFILRIFVFRNFFPTIFVNFTRCSIISRIKVSNCALFLSFNLSRILFNINLRFGCSIFARSLGRVRISIPRKDDPTCTISQIARERFEAFKSANWGSMNSDKISNTAKSGQFFNTWRKKGNWYAAICHITLIFWPPVVHRRINYLDMLSVEVLLWMRSWCINDDTINVVGGSISEGCLR